MLVEIADTYMYGGNYTWADYLGYYWSDVAALLWSDMADTTWGEPLGDWAHLATLTWQEVADFQNYLMLEGFQIEHRIEERSTCSLQIKDLAAAFSFEYGQEVIVKEDNSDIVYGGLISVAGKSMLAPGKLLHTLQVGDYHSLAENRMFVHAYEATSGATVAWDVLDILITEGITIGQIQDDGVALEMLTFNYVTCAEALDKIAELCGYTWFINEEKKLYFVARDAYEATWDIVDGTEIRYEGTEVTNGNPEYRNIQYLQGGQAETSELTEYFIGDGTVKTFTVGYPLAKEPHVYVNTAEQAVGIKGLSEVAVKWEWNKGDPVVTQVATESPLAITDDLKIVYFGAFKLMCKVSQMAEITRQKVVQGFGTGKIERRDTDNSLQDLVAATDAAKAKLSKFAVIGRTLTYTTDTSGLAAGTLQTVTLTELGIVAEDLLIVSVVMTAPEGHVTYVVEAVEGPVDQSWQTFFCALSALARRKQFEEQGVSETVIVQGLEAFSKTWLVTEHPNIFLEVFPDTATPADVDFPCLASEDRLTHLVLYTGGAEFFRKAITLQTQTATDIESTTIVLSSEANGIPIDYVGLFGGVQASLTPASGIEMNKFAYVKTKSSLESLQFDISNLKWA